jgi:hypothetical protein
MLVSGVAGVGKTRLIEQLLAETPHVQVLYGSGDEAETDVPYDTANKNIPSWRMVRTSTAKYIQTYNATGGIIAREYYNLTNDPAENTNFLGDGNAANDPPASTITNLTNRLNTFSACSGVNCVG